MLPPFDHPISATPPGGVPGRATNHWAASIASCRRSPEGVTSRSVLEHCEPSPREPKLSGSRTMWPIWASRTAHCPSRDGNGPHATVQPHDRRCFCCPLWQYQGSVEVDAVRAWNTYTLDVHAGRLKGTRGGLEKTSSRDLPLFNARQAVRASSHSTNSPIRTACLGGQAAGRHSAMTEARGCRAGPGCC
jgi:hypothetical protein